MDTMLLPSSFGHIHETGDEFRIRKVDDSIEVYKTLKEAYNACKQDAQRIEKLSWKIFNYKVIRWTPKFKIEKWNPISELLLCKLNPRYEACAENDNETLFWILQNVTNLDYKGEPPYYCKKLIMNEFGLIMRHSQGEGEGGGSPTLEALELASLIVTILTDEQFTHHFHL